jgi:hypothetical protein
MRRHLVLALAACGHGSPATPPATGSGSAQVVSTTAHPVAADAAAPPVEVDAAAPSLTLSRQGLGPLGRFEWWKQDEDATAKRIATALAALPGITVKFDVVDVPGEVEREEGYWSVRRKDDELVAVLRQSGDKGELPAAVIVWTAEIPTDDGSRVTDKLSAVLARHPDLACTFAPDGMVAETIAAPLQCHSAAAPELVYLVKPPKKDPKAGALDAKKLGDLAVAGIAHVP